MVTDALIVQAINESERLNRREKRRYVRRFSNLGKGRRGELRGQLSARVAIAQGQKIEASEEGDEFDWEVILNMLLNALFDFLIKWLQSRG